MLQVVITYLVLAAILFVSSGRMNWIWAWAYLGLGLGIIIINVSILPAELIAERGQPRDNMFAPSSGFQRTEHARCWISHDRHSGTSREWLEIFYTLWEAKVLVERWRKEYNQVHPHSSLGYRPPAPEAIEAPAMDRAV
jgi:hypothetical protein